MQTGGWKRFMACALLTGALLAGCSKDAAAPTPKAAAAAAAPGSRAGLGKADSVAGGVKVVLLELKRDGPDALMVRWQLRNDTDDKIEVTALSSAGMNPWRLSRGVAVRDASGADYPLLEGASAPQAAKHDAFAFSARFAWRADYAIDGEAAFRDGRALQHAVLEGGVVICLLFLPRKQKSPTSYEIGLFRLKMVWR